MSGVSERFARREDRLLDIGRRLIVEEGFAGLTIGNLAKLEKCSRPTIYQHFKSADEVFERVARRALGHAEALLALACACQGDTRSRMIAHMTCHELMGRFYPEDYNVVEFLGFPWVQKKFSKELSVSYGGIIERYMQILGGIVRDALQNGELRRIPCGLTAPQFCSHLLSLINGFTTTIVKQRLAHRLSEPVDEWHETRSMLSNAFNGLGWEPFVKDESEVEAFYHNLIRETFPEHWIQLETKRLKAEVEAAR